MSKKKQQEIDYTNPKAVREAEARKKEQRSNRMYAAIGIAFAVVALIVVIWNSGIIEKKATAVTINGKGYNSAEVNYYYYNAYNAFLQQYGDYASYMGLDTQKPLKTQNYSETETWHDHFLTEAKTQMAAIYALNAKADAAGFAWTEEMQKQLDDSLASLEAVAKERNYNNGKQYLKALYGPAMSMGVYEEQLKCAILAGAYSTDYQDNLRYTDADLSAEYTKNKKNYDVVEYSRVLIDGTVPTTDADGKEVEVTDAMKTEAMAKSKATATKVYADFKGGKALKALADEYEGSYYTTTGGDAYSESDLMNWLFDDARKDGDSTLLEVKDTGCYVISFNSRHRNDYKTQDVRHILITPEEVKSELAQDDPNYQADTDKLTAAAKTAAKAKADALLKEWKAGAATADSFAALAKENSTDSGSASNGGLYEKIYKNQMVETFNDWCFDSSRKAGDSGVVETDYGYHIMYYVGNNVPYWKVQVENTLKSDAFNTWYTEQTKDFTATDSSFGLKFVG